MLMRFHIAATLCGSLLALALCACSGGSSSPAAQQAIPQSGGTDATAMSALANGPRTWSIQAGASTLDQAFQDLDFYDGSITIDAGDSVTWRVASTEPHTVSFLLPGQAISAGWQPRANRARRRSRRRRNEIRQLRPAQRWPNLYR